MRREETSDPYVHAANLERMLRDVRNHASEDIERVDDERARLLFETAAQVLEGLIKSFEEYQESSGMIRDGLPDSVHPA